MAREGQENTTGAASCQKLQSCGQDCPHARGPSVRPPSQVPLPRSLWQDPSSATPHHSANSPAQSARAPFVFAPPLNADPLSFASGEPFYPNIEICVFRALWNYSNGYAGSRNSSFGVILLESFLGLGGWGGPLPFARNIFLNFQ